MERANGLSCYLCEFIRLCCYRGTDLQNGLVPTGYLKGRVDDRPRNKRGSQCSQSNPGRKSLTATIVKAV